MSSRWEHEARATHNQDLFAHLTATAAGVFPDWEATSLFYVAVHLVEALLAVRGLHSRDHRERRGHVMRYLPTAHAVYRQLEYLSRDARYAPEVSVTPQHLAEAVGWLQQVRAEVRRELP